MQQLSCLHYLLSSHPCIGGGRKGFHRYQQHIGGEWAKAMSGAEFLLGSQNDIHVFATEDNLKILAEADDSTWMEHFESHHERLLPK